MEANEARVDWGVEEDRQRTVEEVGEVVDERRSQGVLEVLQEAMQSRSSECQIVGDSTRYEE